MAIKKNELRIGNYISRYDLGDNSIRIERVLELMEKRVTTTGPIKVICSYKDIKPIELSTEWLEMFGFKQNDNSYNWWCKEADCSIDVEPTIQPNAIELLFYYILSEQRRRSLCYVHQLQNLYFSLTGTELCIKRVGKNLK